MFGALAVGAFIAIGAVGNMLPDQKKSAVATAPPGRSATPSLKAASPMISSVNVSGDALMIHASIDAPTPDHYFDQIVDVVEPLTAAFQKAHAEDTSAVRDLVVTFTTPGHDRLGNPVSVTLVTVGFSAADLRAAHFDHLAAYDRLDLATHVSIDDPSLAPALVQWCNGGAGQFVRPFCAKAGAAT